MQESPTMSDPTETVTITHDGVEGRVEVTRAAFDADWAELGWVIDEPTTARAAVTPPDDTSGEASTRR